MRIEIGGAQVTDAVVEVLDTLQNQPEIVRSYLQIIDSVSRMIILDISDDDDTKAMSRLRGLQMIRRDIVTIATPPDVDDPANDTPRFSV